MKLIDNSNAKIFTIGTIVLTTLGVLIKVLDNGSEKLASPNTDNISSNTVPETYKTSSSSNTSMQIKAEDTPLNDIDHENKTEKNIGEDKSIYINKINKIEEILQDAKEQIGYYSHFPRYGVLHIKRF